MTTSQRKAAYAHRARAKAQGLARIEVQAPVEDVSLIRVVAEVLRGEPTQARRLREAIGASIPGSPPRNAFDIFGSDLPDTVFDGVFEQPRQKEWREVDL